MQATIDPVIAVRTVILSEGNLALAAERLHTNTATLIATIAQDASASELMAAQVRSKLVLDVSDNLNKLSMTLQERMSNLTTQEAFKAYNLMATLLTTIIDTNNNPNNPSTPEALLRMLPPGASDAVRKIMAQKQTSTSTQSEPSKDKATSKDKTTLKQDHVN